MAADFGHAHTFGRAYYVATRFFDRQHRTLQPGFLLAYAEAECLRRAGFALWDLGGADRSPMMQYKPQVALEMHRSEFLLRLSELACAEGWGEGGRPMTDLEAAPPPGGERVPLGVVFQVWGGRHGVDAWQDLGEEDLWGAVALRSQEGAKAKAEPKVRAKKAEKKVKPQPEVKKALIGKRM